MRYPSIEALRRCFPPNDWQTLQAPIDALQSDERYALVRWIAEQYPDALCFECIRLDLFCEPCARRDRARKRAQALANGGDE